MGTPHFAKVDLTDILVDVALYTAHVPFVFAGGYFRISLKGSNEMRLVIKMALISNIGEG